MGVPGGLVAGLLQGFAGSVGPQLDAKRKQKQGMQDMFSNLLAQEVLKGNTELLDNPEFLKATAFDKNHVDMLRAAGMRAAGIRKIGEQIEGSLFAPEEGAQPAADLGGGPGAPVPATAQTVYDRMAPGMATQIGGVKIAKPVPAKTAASKQQFKLVKHADGSATLRVYDGTTLVREDPAGEPGTYKTGKSGGGSKGEGGEGSGGDESVPLGKLSGPSLYRWMVQRDVQAMKKGKAAKHFPDATVEYLQSELDKLDKKSYVDSLLRGDVPAGDEAAPTPEPTSLAKVKSALGLGGPPVAVQPPQEVPPAPTKAAVAVDPLKNPAFQAKAQNWIVQLVNAPEGRPTSDIMNLEIIDAELRNLGIDTKKDYLMATRIAERIFAEVDRIREQKRQEQLPQATQPGTPGSTMPRVIP